MDDEKKVTSSSVPVGAYEARQRAQENAIYKNQKDIERLKNSQPAISDQEGNQLIKNADGLYAKPYDDTEIQKDIEYLKEKQAPFIILHRSTYTDEWFKFAETTFPTGGANIDRALSFKMTDLVRLDTDFGPGKPDDYYGIATVMVRLNGRIISEPYMPTFTWEYLSANVPTKDFVLAYQNKDDGIYVSLWARIEQTSQSVGIKVIASTDFRVSLNYNAWTLFDQPVPVSNIPDELVQIPSVVLSLHEPNAQSTILQEYLVISQSVASGNGYHICSFTMPSDADTAAAYTIVSLFIEDLQRSWATGILTMVARWDENNKFEESNAYWTIISENPEKLSTNYLLKNRFKYMVSENGVDLYYQPLTNYAPLEIIVLDTPSVGLTNINGLGTDSDTGIIKLDMKANEHHQYRTTTKIPDDAKIVPLGYIANPNLQNQASVIADLSDTVDTLLIAMLEGDD